MKHATYDQVVPREMYVRVVKRIKRKYNTEWLEKWKTRTDTTKHVYEDINTGLSPRLHILFSIHLPQRLETNHCTQPRTSLPCSRWREPKQASHRSLFRPRLLW